MSQDPQNSTVVTNPLAAAVTAQVQTQLVNLKPIKFNFRKTEIEEKDKDTGETVKKEWKRPSITIDLPLMTAAGVAAALSASDKSTELVLEMVNSAVIDTARGFINEAIEGNPAIELTKDVLSLDKLGFLAIALMPRGERGLGIPKEDFAAFVVDYKAVMATPQAVALFPDKKPRSPEILEKHGILLAGKFNQVRSRKDVVQQMRVFLDVWAQVSENIEEHATVYEFLMNKSAALLAGESFDEL